MKITLLLMKTFVVETFNNLCKITVADANMKSTDLIMNATNKPYHFIIHGHTVYM